MVNGAVALSWDTETTGVSVFNDRAVQVAMGTVDRAGNIIETFEWIINPGVPVPQEASDVHGFSNEFLAENGQDPKEALAEVIDKFREYWTLPWIIMNANFDVSLLDSEFERHGLATGWGDVVYQRVRLYDPLVIDRKKDKYRRGPRTLLNLANQYRVAVNEDALHDATEDLRVAAQVTMRILEKFGDVSNADQAVWYAEWSDGIRDYYTRQGKDASGFTGEWPVRRTRTKEDQ